MGLAVAQPGVLLEAQLAGQAGRAADDLHGAPVVHVDLPDDQVVDAGHHLRPAASFLSAALSGRRTLTCMAPMWSTQIFSMMSFLMLDTTCAPGVRTLSAAWRARSH